MIEAWLEHYVKGNRCGDGERRRIRNTPERLLRLSAVQSHVVLG